VNWIQIGMAKSGNSWLYRLLRGILERSGHWEGSWVQRQPLFEEARDWELSQADQAEHDVVDITPEGIFWRIASRVREPVEDVDAYLRRARLVWTHSPWCERTRSFLGRFEKKVYLCRDPRDVAISTAHFTQTPYMREHYPVPCESAEEWLDLNFEQALRDWVLHVGPYLRQRRELDIHWLFYERMKADIAGELRGLLDYLEVDLDRGQQQDLIESTRFERMRRDQPGHLREGRGGQWREVLDDRQAGKAREIAGPMMRLMGYPVERSRETLPALADGKDREEAIRQAIRTARPGIGDILRRKTRHTLHRLFSGRSGGPADQQGEDA